MKKLVSIITLIMTMMVLSISAYAFSNEFYSVDVGEGFKEESLNETLVLNSTEKDGSINIVMNKAVEGKDYFTQDEIEKQKPVITEGEFAIDKRWYNRSTNKFKDSFKITDYTGKYDLKDADQPKSGDSKAIPTGLIGGIAGGILGGLVAFFVVKSKQSEKGRK